MPFFIFLLQALRAVAAESDTSKTLRDKSGNLGTEIKSKAFKLSCCCAATEQSRLITEHFDPCIT